MSHGLATCGLNDIRYTTRAGRDQKCSIKRKKEKQHVKHGHDPPGTSLVSTCQFASLAVERGP